MKTFIDTLSIKVFNKKIPNPNFFVIISLCLITLPVAFITAYNFFSLFTPFNSYSKSTKIFSFLFGLLAFYFAYLFIFKKFLVNKLKQEPRSWWKHVIIAIIFATLVFATTYAHLPLYLTSLKIQITTTSQLAYFQTRVKLSNDTLRPIIFSQSLGEWNSVGAELVHLGINPGELTFEGLEYVSDNTQFSFLFLPQQEKTSATIELDQNVYDLEVPSSNEHGGYFSYEIVVPRLHPLSLISQIWIAVFPFMRWLFIFSHFLIASIFLGFDNHQFFNAGLKHFLLLISSVLLYNALLFRSEFINFQTFNAIWLIVSIIAFLFFPLLIIRVLQRNQKLNFIIVFLIFSLAIALRLYWIKMVPTAQVSDFGAFHKWALQLASGEGGLYIDRYSTFTRLVGLVYKIYPSHNAIELLNIFFSLLTMFSIWKIGKAINQENAGILGAYLFSIFPSQISLVSIVCTDIIAVGLFSLSLLFMIKYLQNNKLVFLVASTIIFGFALAVRMPLFIYSPVFLLIFIQGKNPFSEKKTYYNFLFLVTGIIVGYFSIKGIASTIQVPDLIIEEGRNIIWPLLNGTNIDSLGRNNKEDDILVHTWSEDETFGNGISIVLKRLTENPIEFFNILKYKFSYMFGDATYGAYTAFLGEDMNYSTFRTNWPIATDHIRIGFASLCQYSYIIILGLASIYSVVCCKSLDSRITLLIATVLISSLVFYSFFEVQPRYQRPIIPSVILLAAISLISIKGKIIGRN